ncbi:hypothetical protein TNIN_308941 [Trichonephila inaurata madagascariensis]|uniref:Uncharacterized protein n=1 Tax=Trichonephila inaurata madagascariensis TaxID=2747483 RepID=A0A8X6Y4S7_9ARAC|nr:hypothetical protein TNIN_308941 [Trichonephila inaurata madagascariensis]
MKRKRSSLRVRKSLKKYSSKIICQGFRSENSLKMELNLEHVMYDVCEGLRIAREKLRARVQVLEDVRNHLNSLLLIDQAELISAIQGKTTLQEIRSLLPNHFNDGEYLIGLIERNVDFLAGITDHPESQPSARDDFKRLHTKFLRMKVDITLFLGFIEQSYHYGITGVHTVKN